MPRSVNETNPREDAADPSTENDPRSPTPERRRQSSRTRTLTEKGELFSYALLSGLLKAYLAHNDKMTNYVKNFDIESTNTGYLAACIGIYDTYYETFLALNEDIIEYLNVTLLSQFHPGPGVHLSQNGVSQGSWRGGGGTEAWVNFSQRM